MQDSAVVDTRLARTGACRAHAGAFLMSTRTKKPSPA